MSIQDLRTRLHDVPGIESLSMTMLGGRQIYVFDRHTVALDASASDVEVTKAIRESGVAGGGYRADFENW